MSDIGVQANGLIAFVNFKDPIVISFVALSVKFSFLEKKLRIKLEIVFRISFC